MEKMRMESMDIVAKNIDKIAELFPSCITEKVDDKGNLEKAIDFDVLRQILGDKVATRNEAYEFTWVGKNASRVEANTTTNKTLRPCIEESKDWDNTKNLYIEGDNLEVLKLLQNSYFNKVKMIYIDPPYNTGNDFIYIDDFAQNIDEYEEAKGSFDEEGNRLFKNTDTNGRFHSDWCSMIYPRLILARNLLADDGVIFISIDDNEQENLKKICDEVFGEKNFIGEIIRKTKSITNDIKNGLNIQHEALLVYAKYINLLKLIGNEKKLEGYKNPDNDPNGEWCSGDPSAKSGGEGTYFEIKNLYTGKSDFPPKGRYWAFSRKTFDEYIKKGKILFKKVYKANERGFIFKRYKNELKDRYNPLNSLFAIENKYMNQIGTKELNLLFKEIDFIYPKPVNFIKLLITSLNDKSSIILDFFSGSATTAHAVMQLNAEDGGKRKFIMVQLPEKTDEKSEAFKAGYKNICEIGKERIRRAGEKIKEEAGLNGQDLDIGFRVLKLDSSNMKDIYYSADEYDQGMLENMQSNTKEDRTDLDLLFGCLVDWGLELDKPYTIKKINGHKVHIYNDGDLVACFEKDLDMKTIDEIAKLQALRVVFCDNSFVDSATKINVAEHFKMIAPDTDIKVI